MEEGFVNNPNDGSWAYQESDINRIPFVSLEDQPRATGDYKMQLMLWTPALPSITGKTSLLYG